MGRNSDAWKQVLAEENNVWLEMCWSALVDVC
jgi:hypothetical protein